MFCGIDVARWTHRAPLWRLVDRGCRSRDDAATSDRAWRPRPSTTHRIRPAAMASPDGQTVDSPQAAPAPRILTISRGSRDICVGTRRLRELHLFRPSLPYEYSL